MKNGKLVIGILALIVTIGGIAFTHTNARVDKLEKILEIHLESTREGYERLAVIETKLITIEQDIKEIKDLLKEK